MAGNKMHHDVRTALEVAARRRHCKSLVRKEKQKHKLTTQAYHRMQIQLNEMSFLAPIDAGNTKSNIYYVKRKFMRFCRENQHGNWKKAAHWQYCDKGLIMVFLFWICETYFQPRRKRSKKKTVSQYWRDFKMLYRRLNEGRVVNANDCEEIQKYINGDLTVKFNLDDQPSPKPVLGVDDLILGLTQHWCRDRSIFPTEDDRLDLPTIMLLQSYTACRPAELVDGTKSRGGADPLLDDSDDDEASARMPASRPVKNKPTIETQPMIPNEMEALKLAEEGFSSESSAFECDDSDGSDSDDTSDTDYDSDDSDSNDDENFKNLKSSIETDKARTCTPGTSGDDADYESARKHKALCYEDIVLWIVQDPNGGRDVLAMEVVFRHHKGADRKPKPTIFLFRENPLPMLCPISHLLARAIRDDAIEVDGFNQAAPLFSTRIGRKANKVHWKPSVLKMPLFRRSIRTAAGWVKSKTEPMKYSTYAFYLDRIGSELGSEEKWTSYCFRRGHANALLGVAPDSIVDQVMRHDPLTGCMQNAYQNRRVGFNTQDAFLERDPSADGLTRAFTHMSIRCNPEVPRTIPKADLAELPPDPEVVSLLNQVKAMACNMRQQYGFIKSAPKEVREKYQQLRRDLRNTEKGFRDDMTKVYQEAYRRRIHNEELQRQLGRLAIEPQLGLESKVEPVVQHQLEERTQLQAILSDFRQDLDPNCLAERKIRAIDTMVLLASRRELRSPAQSPTPSVQQYESSVRGNSPGLDASDHDVSMEDVPLMLGNTQCIYCIGEERLPYNRRIRSFKRVSHMMDHVETVHLKYERKRGKFVCPHPHCQHLGEFLTGLDHFKNHVQRVHGVKLRKQQDQ